VADLVLPQVDERVLLGELGEREVERAAVGRRRGFDDRLQCRRGKLAYTGVSRSRKTDRVADLDVGETPELADLTGRDRGRRTTDPRSNTPIAVTLVPVASGSSRSCSRSRVRTVPENIRTYAIFSPAAPRSTLKTVPDTEPSTRPSAAGSNAVMPAVNESTPAPVIADPRYTGCTSA